MEALARRAAAPVFALALFSSAALIFVLQPLFARIVTPLLGGSPAVWNTSMAFFQGALLVGYLYAHLLARVKDLRIQALAHGLVLAAAWLVLPVQASEALGPPNSEHPALWLLGVLTLSVGAPFAAASATAPLLQSWYARTGRADAHDPYYLYAASNLGSFAGLLAYPAIIEPLLGAHAQSVAWSAAYLAVFALIALSATTAIAAHGQIPRPLDPGPATNWRQRLYWIAAAAVPSALSLGVTLHITTDVASAPMLWVIPLALYLVTFVIAFMRGGERLTPLVQIAQPLAVALLVVSYLGRTNWAGLLFGNLAGFFLSALVCHFALARTRPDAGRLTEFYFWVSLGGVAGGAFAAFVAPVIFNDIYEYPLALAAAMLFLPRGPVQMPRLADVAIAAAATMAIIAALLMRLQPHHVVIMAGMIGSAGAFVAAGWSDEGRPAPMRYAFMVCAGLVGALMIAASLNLESVFSITPTEGAVDRLAIAPAWSWAILIAAFLTLTFAAHASIQPRREANLIGDIGTGITIPPMLLLISLMVMSERLDARVIVTVGLAICALALVINRTRPVVMSGLVALAFGVIFLDDGRDVRVAHQERSFFGVLRTIVYEQPDDTNLPDLKVLMHGTTIHGAQLVGGPLARQPLTYYHPETALGEAILAGVSTKDDVSLALIGLGAGSTACLTRPTDRLVIFEIDPAVVRLAAQPGREFTFVQECQPNARVELGDARLQIAEEPDGSFDVIVVDAFSSDAIPAHLLTREALDMYLDKTSPRGIVVLHLSNRNLALVSEARRVAASLNAPTLWRVSDRVEFPLAPVYGGLGASVMIVARDPLALAALPLQSQQWTQLDTPPGQPWTDDYVNLPRALWDQMTGVEECRLFPYVQRCLPAEARDAPPEEGEGG